MRNQESRVRRRARSLGYTLRKDRARTLSVNRQGAYMLLDATRNVVVLGERFDATLDDVLAFLE